MEVSIEQMATLWNVSSYHFKCLTMKCLQSNMTYKAIKDPEDVFAVSNGLE